MIPGTRARSRRGGSSAVRSTTSSPSTSIPVPGDASRGRPRHHPRARASHPSCLSLVSTASTRAGAIGGAELPPEALAMPASSRQTRRLHGRLRRRVLQRLVQSTDSLRRDADACAIRASASRADGGGGSRAVVSVRSGRVGRVVRVGTREPRHTGIAGAGRARGRALASHLRESSFRD